MNKKYESRRKQYNATYYQKHRAEAIARSKNRRQEVPAETVAYMAEYYRAHREELLTRSLQRQRDNPKRHTEIARRWKKRNPEVGQACKSRRRARIWAEMTREDRAISVEYRKAIANDSCFYCGASGEQVDHYQSLVKGGTDHWWNLVRSCAPCNAHKGTMHGDDFLKLFR